VDQPLSADRKAARPFGNCAQVRAADHVTRYTRCGSGHPVLLLYPIEPDVAEAECAAIWADLVDRLAQHRRVIVPEIPTTGSRFATWLRGFIDGIGLPALTLVAAGPACMPALEFVLTDPERVERLVLIPVGGAEETGLVAVLTPVVGAAAIPMMVVRRDQPAGDAVAVVERFLGGAMA
jgi:pimeloyl-ACP methyl ester carboxylesterase